MKSRYQSLDIYQRTVRTMLGTLIVLALVYSVVLLSLVFSVIERKQNTITNRDLGSKLSTLEANYANQVSSINSATLLANDYKNIDGATFSVRKDAIASYTVLYAR